MNIHPLIDIVFMSLAAYTGKNMHFVPPVREGWRYRDDIGSDTTPPCFRRILL
jgi:hypothetical protein